MRLGRLRRYRPLSLLLGVVLFLIVMMQVAYLSRQQALEELQQQAVANMGRYVLSVQQKLDRYKDLPQVMASHSRLRDALAEPEDAGRIDRANRYLQQITEVVGATDSYLMGPNGLTLAASNWYKEKSFVGRNFSFRPYFQDAMEGKAGRYFALGTTSRRRGYFFSWPIWQAEKVIGVAVVKIDLQEIERDWNDPLQDIAVTDEDGVIVIATRPEWKFHTLHRLSPSDLKRILESLRYLDHPLEALEVVRREQLEQGGELITLLEGDRIRGSALDGLKTTEYLLVQRPVPGTGLNVSIMARLTTVNEAVLQAMVLAAFVYIALVLLVLFLQARWRIGRERRAFQRRELNALAERERQVSAIITNTHAGLITLDSQGRVESVNPTAEKLFGISVESIRDHAFTELIRPEEHEACERVIGAASCRDMPELTLESSGVRADGSHFPIELTIGCMALAGDRHFIVTVHDMTERKQYEDELQRAREALETRVEERTSDLRRTNDRLLEEMQQHRSTQNELIQTAKLAVLGQLAAGINHELNQPLTAIRNYADNAAAFLKLNKPERVEVNLQEIAGLTERMAKIIHPLKEFSRQSSDQPGPTSLKAVRDGAMSMMYGRLDKSGVELNWPELNDIYVLGDTLRLEQVLVNLLSNALQAMAQSPVKRIDVTLEQAEGLVRLKLHDTGPGIAADDMQRVFEPFFTTKQRGEGLGLGLSISHRIMENLGGRLSVANHPQGGALFTLELPAVAEREYKEMP